MDDFVVIGPDGKPMPMDSMAGIMKNPQMAQGVLNMFAEGVGDKWQAVGGEMHDNVLTLLAHAKNAGVHDVAAIFVQELIQELTNLHELQVQAFDQPTVDYHRSIELCKCIERTRDRFLPGMPESLAKHLASILPKECSTHVLELGVNYQKLVFFINMCKDTFTAEKLVEQRKYYSELCRTSWNDVTRDLTETCRANVPPDICRRTRKEGHMWTRLVSEGMAAAKAWDEASTHVRMSRTSEAYCKWLDATFELDSEDSEK